MVWCPVSISRSNFLLTFTFFNFYSYYLNSSTLFRQVRTSLLKKRVMEQNYCIEKRKTEKKVMSGIKSLPKYISEPGLADHKE